MMRFVAPFALLSFIAAPAFAAPPAVAKAGQGQPALAVGFDQKGVLRAKTCAAQPCSVEQGVDLGLPSELANKAASSSIKVVRIGPERRAVVISVPSVSLERSWEAVVAAPLAGDKPVVYFAGYTGWVQGEDSLRRGSLVQVKETSDGAYGILVGEQREDLTLCGRPTLLAPSVLDSKTMKLVPAKVQQLGADERASAPELLAKPVPAGAPSGPALVQVLGATSALDAPPGALVDGDTGTSWSEARSGSGRGDFVLLKGPDKLPLQGVEFVFRPTAKEPPHGTAPKQFYLASTNSVFRVSVPADAWQTPGARYAVTFEKPLADDCLAVVLDSAADEGANAAVTFTELRARTEFENADPKTLVGALAGGGKRAEAAGSVLRSLGKPGFEAVAERFGDLDEGGRRVALGVIDAADCSIKVPVYLRALGEQVEAEREHARPRLRRCGPAAAEALRASLPQAKGKAFEELANELAIVAPKEAVNTFVPLLEEKQVARRKVLRVALGRLAALPEGATAIRAELANAALPEVATLDLLRALGDRAPSFEPHASQALARVSAGAPSFRTRYLRTAPAGALSLSAPAAQELLSSALTADPSPEVRAQAARVVRAPEQFRKELMRALEDREVRVREAAARALAKPSGAFAAEALRKRLEEDRWPIVRGASALALAEYGADASSDRALVSALEDEAWLVRRDVALALGRRKVRSATEGLTARLDDDQERFEVRVAAAKALGESCDAAAADMLAKHALRLQDPLATNEARAIGLAALGSLANLGTPDLRQRLAPLLSKNAPRGSRDAAEGALRARSGCK
jgi:HEAT repeat protein